MLKSTGAAVRRQDPGGDRAGQHQQRADQRVDEHLEGGRLGPDRSLALLGPPLVLRPPAPEQEVERDQHQVEEEDEQDQVLGQEGAEHRRLGEPEHQEVEPRPLGRVDRRPDRRRQPEDRSEQDEEEADPVDPELVAHAERGDPARVDGVLEAAGRVEAGDDDDRHHEGDERPDGRHPTRHPAGEAARRPAPKRERRPEQDLDHASPLMSSATGSRGRARRSR